VSIADFATEFELIEYTYYIVYIYGENKNNLQGNYEKNKIKQRTKNRRIYCLFTNLLIY
jgi:hypothetical protein